MKGLKLVKKPDTAAAPVKEPERLKKRCPCGKLTPGGETCAACKDHDEMPSGTLRRSAIGAGPAAAPPIVGDVLRGSGQALPAPVRSAIEPQFGRDFGNVRVHTGPQAADSARAVQARAYTVGDHVVFGDGEYAPNTPDGLWLLSHELAHVAQGADGMHQVADEDAIPIGAEHDPAEAEADRAADAVLSGHRAAVSTHDAPATVRRAPWGPCPKGEAVPANDEQIYTAAEQKIVDYYLAMSPNPARVFTNSAKGAGRLKDLQINDPFLALTKEGFFNNLRADRDLSRPAEQTTPAARKEAGLTEEELADFQEAQVPIMESATKEPDILDFNTLEVFDVTTQNVRDTGDKRDKIRTYVDLLNTVLVDFRKHYKQEAAALPKKKWTAGTSLKKPPGNVFLFSLTTPANETIHICYGPTDLTGANVGIIAYRALRGVTEPGAVAGNYEIKAAGRTLTFQIRPNVRNSLAGQPDASFVGGLELLEYIPGSPDRITARRARTGTAGQLITFGKLLEFDVTKDRQLKLRGKAQGFKFRHLSEGTATLELTDEGLVGTGKLRSSLPLLRNVPFNVSFEREQVTLSLDADPAKISPAVPGLKFTQASLGLKVTEQEFSAQGTLVFAIGPAKSPYVDGTLTVTADASGLVATGKVNAHIPGVDRAEGDVTYRDRELSGSIEIQTEQIKGLIPGVQSAAVRAQFSNRGFTIGGSVDVLLPGNHPATLHVSYANGRVHYGGKATFRVPHLKPVVVTLGYDGKHFSGSAKTGLTIGGLTGDITVNYLDGVLYGGGRLDLEKGKAKGHVEVELSKRQKLSGKGSITYPLPKNLIGTVGVTLDENGKVRVDGELRFAKPLHLFDGYRGKRVFFRFDKSIPIPGLSIGPIGLRGKIGAEFGAEYGVGPGTLQDVFLAVGFDPLEADPNVEVAGGGKLVIPAFLKVYVSVDAGVEAGVDIAIAHAEAGGGLNVRGDVTLHGGITAATDFKYKQHQFELNANVTVKGGLTVGLSLGIYVEAEAGFWRWTVKTRKDWTLARFEWGSGAQLEIGFPFHYATDRTFQPPPDDPSKEQKPSIDFVEVIRQMISRSDSTEKEL